MPLTVVGVAFVPSMRASGSSVAVLGPKRARQLISRILFHMETMDRIGGIQQAALRSVAVPRLKAVGAGMT